MGACRTSLSPYSLLLTRLPTRERTAPPRSGRCTGLAAYLRDAESGGVPSGVHLACSVRRISAFCKATSKPVARGL
jgi:hypothetical protein